VLVCPLFLLIDIFCRSGESRPPRGIELDEMHLLKMMKSGADPASAH